MPFKYNSDYLRHLKSKKHIEKINSGETCSGCFKQFSNKSNKTRHQKDCKEYKDTIVRGSNVGNNQSIDSSKTININAGVDGSHNVFANNININIQNADATFVMKIEELLKNSLVDCFQKIILEEMRTNKFNIMDFISKFDNNLEKAHRNIIEEHNSKCFVYESVSYIGDDGERKRDTKKITPLSDIDYVFECKHEKSGFKLNEEQVSDILAMTLLNENDKIVITHNSEISGIKNMLFKHKEELHEDKILLEFVERIKNKELCNLSIDFNPNDIIKNKYPEYYDKLKEKIIKIKNAYNETTRVKSLNK